MFVRVHGKSHGPSTRVRVWLLCLSTNVHLRSCQGCRVSILSNWIEVRRKRALRIQVQIPHYSAAQYRIDPFSIFTNTRAFILIWTDGDDGRLTRQIPSCLIQFDNRYVTELQVWVNAAAQNFNSIGIAFGSMITFSSYNKRDNRLFRYRPPIVCVFRGEALLSLLSPALYLSLRLLSRFSRPFACLAG